jgi:hypothetical protein
LFSSPTRVFGPCWLDLLCWHGFSHVLTPRISIFTSVPYKIVLQASLTEDRWVAPTFTHALYVPNMDNTSCQRCTSQRCLVEAGKAEDYSILFTILTTSNIRLITIEPGSYEDAISISIDTVDLTHRAPYEALSYVWNPKCESIDATSGPVTITVNNYPDLQLAIRPNPAAAIRRLRSPQDLEVYWIDAVSINRTDDLRKNHQVGMMEEIYSAEKLVVM